MQVLPDALGKMLGRVGEGFSLASVRARRRMRTAVVGGFRWNQSPVDRAMRERLT
jgi:hypothetical protein